MDIAERRHVDVLCEERARLPPPVSWSRRLLRRRARPGDRLSGRTGDPSRLGAPPAAGSGPAARPEPARARGLARERRGHAGRGVRVCRSKRGGEVVTGRRLRGSRARGPERRLRAARGAGRPGTGDPRLSRVAHVAGCPGDAWRSARHHAVCRRVHAEAPARAPAAGGRVPGSNRSPSRESTSCRATRTARRPRAGTRPASTPPSSHSLGGTRSWRS